VTVSSLSEFYRLNGAYLFVQYVAGRVQDRIRNYFIARRLGVKKISIGPYARLRGLAFIEMGELVEAHEGFWLEAVHSYYEQGFSPRIKIGNRVRISQWVHIAATNYVEIGDDVLLGSKVVIIDHNHGQYLGSSLDPASPPARRRLDSDKKVSIGRNVWLGDGVVVTPGSFIGECSIVGANSVVKGNIPPYSLAVGSPARVVKRFNAATKEWEKTPTEI
jgi:lipopolysaccharide O-acetyltransferase